MKIKTKLNGGKVLAPTLPGDDVPPGGRGCG